MSIKRPKSENAFTLIEVMTATVIILIAVIGTSAYRYTTSLFARQSDMHMTAARTALLLCESWRGNEGSENFDPTVYSSSNLNISTLRFASYAPIGFNVLGRYQIVISGDYYYATLSYKDAAAGLRVLNVTIAWKQHASDSTGFLQADKTIELTTYVAN